METKWSVAGDTISDDGRRVAFAAKATNLVPGDTNNTWDVFVRDLQTGTTTRASLDTTGHQLALSLGSPAISADGRFVTFESDAAAGGGELGEVSVRDLDASRRWMCSC